LHVLAVIYHWVALKSNLILPMMTGRKQLMAGLAAPIIASPVRSLLCLFIAGAVVYWWVFA
jgi:hypothetical protein